MTTEKLSHITPFRFLKYRYTDLIAGCKLFLGRHGQKSAVLGFAFVLAPLASFFLSANLSTRDAGYGVIGGPDISLIVPNISEAAVLNQQRIEIDEEANETDGAETGIVIIANDSILGRAAPIINAVASRSDILQYTVQAGDTMSGIASEFGISLNTIYWANGTGSNIKPGDALLILPVTGVKHDVKEGDTIESIARMYEADGEAIRDFNKVGGVLRAGETLVIPNGKKAVQNKAARTSSKLPSYPGYYLLPATGWNWGQLHAYNAVDIANKCGTPIYAAAEGLVLEESGYGAWNSGYGNYITIEHPNGTKTLYAHTRTNAVSQGEFVGKGDTIASIGNTGKTHGVTGCHLHFEVHGARNPFAR